MCILNRAFTVTVPATITQKKKKNKQPRLVKRTNESKKNIMKTDEQLVIKMNLLPTIQTF